MAGSPDGTWWTDTPHCSRFRRPEIEPGYDTGRYPLRLLLDALAGSEFNRVSPDLPAGFIPSITIENIARDPVTERPVLELEWWSGPPEKAGQELVP